MKKFHRAVSMTLLALASLILVVELCRAGGGYPRIVLTSTLALFCGLLRRISAKITQGSVKMRLSQNGGEPATTGGR